MSQIIGHISQVIGPVVDVYFEGTDAELMLPSIHDALEIKEFSSPFISHPPPHVQCPDTG